MKASEWIFWNVKCNYDKYFGKKDAAQEPNYLNHVQVRDFIEERLKAQEPFMFGKLGATESFVMRAEEFGFLAKRGKACAQLCTWSGFFPENQELMETFNQTMKQALGNVDILLRWYQPYEEYFVKKYANELKGVCGWLNAWASDAPWSKALKGKKVLVIHPFAESIQSQYKRREKIFVNQEILPEFDLKTLKAVQTIGGEKDDRFSDWFDALQYMCEEAMKIDFDIALIGCGAYGFPLASYIKKHGKSAMHLGGDLQMLFGILGKRWEGREDVSRLRNEYWVYPSESEKPKGFSKVEGGCYW